ncbi:MAG TPA: hypothetical protein VGM99_04070 [Candidatus Cybelea sp.]|jgi:hypothetical protein
MAACSTTPSPQLPVSFGPSLAAAPGRMPASQPDRGSSWEDAAASSGPLLYLSDFRNYDVYIYTVPALKMVGKITGFFEPQGECSDNNGNVWITNTGAQQILEFRPGSNRPVAMLDDSTGYPVGCAVDLRNGDLAVTNLFDLYGPGGVLVFKNARGTPRPYLNLNQFYYYFAGYDAHGNLYTDGLTKDNAFTLSLLPSGASKMSTITVRGATLHFPGTIVRSGSSLVIGDQECGGKKTSCLYEAAISGRTAAVMKTIDLRGSCDVAQTALANGRLFGGNYCPQGTSGADRWAFPAGGKPQASVPGAHDPIGAAIVTR